MDMDDKEYYTMMNRSSSWAVGQVLKKKGGEKKGPAAKDAPSYKELELRQGKADAEMLMEKQSQDSN